MYAIFVQGANGIVWIGNTDTPEPDLADAAEGDADFVFAIKLAGFVDVDGEDKTPVMFD